MKHSERDLAIVDALLCGLRVSEVSSCLWGDVQIGEMGCGVLTSRGSSLKPWMVNASGAFEEWLRSGGKSDLTSYVFESKKGDGLSRPQVWRICKNVSGSGPSEVMRTYRSGRGGYADSEKGRATKRFASYVIIDDCFLKVGITVNASSRMASYKAHNPRAMRVCFPAAFPERETAEEWEKSAAEKLSTICREQISNEWFMFNCANEAMNALGGLCPGARVMSLSRVGVNVSHSLHYGVD